MVKSSKFTRALAHVHDKTSEPLADLGRFVGRGAKRVGHGVVSLKDQILEDHEDIEARKAAKAAIEEEAEALVEQTLKSATKKAAQKQATSKPRRNTPSPA